MVATQARQPIVVFHAYQPTTTTLVAYQDLLEKPRQQPLTYGT
jgi:hypothetical protein